MKELILVPKEMPKIPIEADIISPDIVAKKGLSEVNALMVYVGNKRQKLGDYFEVSGETAETPSEQLISVKGSVPNIKYLGAGTTAGRILVNGGVGMHVGANMKGGEIIVEGSASNWAGAEMKGGLLRIEGNAGHQLGAAYRGSSEGMTGGCIFVNGDAGFETGAFMRRGMIVVGGNTGPFTGVHMNGGEIFIFGRGARRLGAEAKGNGGFIAVFGEVESILPTYILDTIYTPTFMKLFLKQLNSELGINEAEKYLDTPFKRYRGDIAVGGNCEILVAEK